MMPRTFSARVGWLLVAGAAGLALHCGAARADSSDTEIMATESSEQMPVRTSDLNLASPADQRTLRHRIRFAAKKVCAKVSAGESLTTDAFIVCYTDAVHSALGVADQRIAAAQDATRLAEGTARSSR